VGIKFKPPGEQLKQIMPISLPVASKKQLFALAVECVRRHHSGMGMEALTVWKNAQIESLRQQLA